MSEVQPQPGDKVRVTVRNVWESVVSEHGNYTAKGWVETEGADVTLEIVERADDPSLDPVGTVAELYDGCVVVKVGDGANDAWVVVGSGELLHAPSSVHGRKVTGAVPGTLAAQAQRSHADCWQPDPNGLCSCEGGKPLVVQYGDPEPDTRRTYRSPNGATVQIGTFGWRVVGTNGDAFINVPWTAIRAEFFPLTEVVGP